MRAWASASAAPHGQSRDGCRQASASTDTACLLVLYFCCFLSCPDLFLLLPLCDKPLLLLFFCCDPRPAPECWPRQATPRYLDVRPVEGLLYPHVTSRCHHPPPTTHHPVPPPSADFTSPPTPVTLLSPPNFTRNPGRPPPHSRPLSRDHSPRLNHLRPPPTTLNHLSPPLPYWPGRPP